MSTQLSIPQNQLRAPSSDERLENMMGAVLDQAITPDTAAVMRELCDLRAKEKQRAAIEAFNRAFVAMQADMPEVQTNKIIPNKDGSTRSTYASYDEIRKTVKPYLKEHGFAVSFTMDAISETRVKAICTLMHRDGHSVTSEFTARGGSGAPGTSTAQQDGGTANFAKRYALCFALDLVIEDAGDDARGEGGPISAELAQELERRFMATGANRTRTLDFAGAKEWAEIPQAKLPDLMAVLERREKEKGITAPPVVEDKEFKF